jgi:cholesterol transport system auxiliary component
MNNYNLDVHRDGETGEQSLAKILKVRRFHIASGFEGSGLVYRTGKVSYESDFYNRFLSPPESIITETVQQWLSESRVFTNITDDRSVVESDYVLEGKVLSLYGDYINPDEPKAVFEIRFSLIDTKTVKHSMVFQKVYRVSSATVSRSPSDLISGYNNCMEEILTEFEKDLREFLKQ